LRCDRPDGVLVAAAIDGSSLSDIINVDENGRLPWCLCTQERYAATVGDGLTIDETSSILSIAVVVKAMMEMPLLALPRRRDALYPSAIFLGSTIYDPPSLHFLQTTIRSSALGLGERYAAMVCYDE